MAAQTPLALSTNRALGFAAAPARETPLALSIVRRNKTQFALSIVDPRVAALDRDRAAAKISHAQLCQDARVHPSTWFFLRRGAQRPRGDTLERLRGAIVGRAGLGRFDHVLIRALHRGAVAMLAAGQAQDPALMLAQDFSVERPQNALWLKAAELRRQAIYLLAVELLVPNADLGRAIGCSRQNVQQARNQVEDARAGNAGLDALLDRLAGVLKGVGA